MATNYKFKIDKNRNNKAYIIYYDENNIDETLKVSNCVDISTSTNIVLRLLDTQTKKSILVVGSYSRDNKLIINVDKDGINEADNAWSVSCKNISDVNNETDNILTINNVSSDFTVIEQL